MAPSLNSLAGHRRLEDPSSSDVGVSPAKHDVFEEYKVWGSDVGSKVPAKAEGACQQKVL